MSIKISLLFSSLITAGCFCIFWFIFFNDERITLPARIIGSSLISISVGITSYLLIYNYFVHRNNWESYEVNNSDSLPIPSAPSAPYLI